MILTIVLFLLAGIAEIGGGYLVWLWLREAKPVSYGIAGSLILVAYGIIPTFLAVPDLWTSLCGLWRCVCVSCCVLGLVGRSKNA